MIYVILGCFDSFISIGKNMADKFFLRLAILAGITILCIILYLLTPILIPFITAFVFAYLLNPLVERLCKIKIPRWLAVCLVFLSIILLMIWAFWYVIPILWKQAVFIKDNFPIGLKWINDVFLPWLSGYIPVLNNVRLDVESITPIVTEYLQTNSDNINYQNIVSVIAKSSNNIIQIMTMLILVPVVTFYSLLDWKQMLARIHALFPIRYRKKMVEIFIECDDVLKAFVKGQFLVMLLLGTIYGVGLQMTGLEIGLMIGLISGLASIIPYAGFAVGIIIAMFATLFQFGFDVVQIILVAVVFGIGQLCEGYILQPFLLGDKIGLSPIAVIFAVLAGAQLAGFVGMIIALPVAAVLVVLLHHLRLYYLQSAWFQLKPKKIFENISDKPYINKEDCGENTVSKANIASPNTDTVKQDKG